MTRLRPNEVFRKFQSKNRFQIQTWIAQILKYNDVKEVTNRDEFEEYFAIGVKY